MIIPGEVRVAAIISATADEFHSATGADHGGRGLRLSFLHKWKLICLILQVTYRLELRLPKLCLRPPSLIKAAVELWKELITSLINISG